MHCSWHIQATTGAMCSGPSDSCDTFEIRGKKNTRVKTLGTHQHVRREDILGEPAGSHGHDDVALDAGPGTLQGQGVGQPHQPELGSTVVGLAEIAKQSGHRGGHNNPSVPGKFLPPEDFLLVLLHVRPGRPRGLESPSKMNPVN